MSTLAVTDIRRTGETASRSTRGIAASWLNLNGTGTIAIRDSLNVSSVVDNGTGDYTENFTAVMANTNYCILHRGDCNSIVDSTAVTTFEVLSVTTSAARLWHGAGATPQDVLRSESAIHGSLA